MSQDCRVVPAILTDVPETLEKLTRQAETFTDYVQFDVMDGVFVPSRSIGVEHIVRLHTGLKWEVHLMVRNPELHFEAYRMAGAKRIVFHYESTHSPREAISLTRDLKVEVGLAINPETPVSEVLPLIDKVDSLLLLSVHPGFYGAKFLPEVLPKAKELREANSEIEIGIDGGIKESNITEVAKAGVNVIYVGSAVFLQADPGECFRRLQKLACD